MNAKQLVEMMDFVRDMSDSVRDPEVEYLKNSGWIPFGKNSSTGLEGWGKMIDGKSVIEDQPKALQIQRGLEGKS